MKYKVGNKVRIKSINWYNENKDFCGCVYAGNGFGFWKNMTKHCGKIMKIASVKIDPEDLNKGYYFMENNKDKWTDEMIEGLTDETEIAQDAKTFSEGYVQGYEDGQHDMNEWILPEGFEFTDENGNVINATKIILEKKKKEYPKTYEECCKVMGVNHTNDLDICEHCDYKTEITYYEDSLLEKIETLYRLIICRDAYWKIAGEEMGLGKPWKPDWNDLNRKYFISLTCDGINLYDDFRNPQILAFPTIEMRDIFYKNFEKLMRLCMEFL